MVRTAEGYDQWLPDVTREAGGMLSDFWLRASEANTKARHSLLSIWEHVS